MDKERLRIISANIEQVEKTLREARDEFPQGEVPREQIESFWDLASMSLMMLLPDLRELVDQLRAE
jgi:hypothetical protein